MNRNVHGASVILFSAFVPPTIGGIATILSSLMDEFLQQGLTLIVVAPTPKPLASEFSDVIWIDSPHIAAGRQAWQRYVSGQADSWEKILSEMEQAGANIAKEILPFEPDLIHSHSDWFLGGMVASLLGIPHVATLHGYPPNPEDFEAEGLAYNERIDKVRDQVKRMYCTVMTAVSHFAKKRWVEVGLPAEMISVIHNPIRFDLFHPQPPDVRDRLRRELGVSLDVKLPCFPQRPDKFGVDTLLTAFSNLRRTRSDVVLLLCACDDLPPALNRRAANLGIGPSMLVRSFALEEMPGVYAASDIVILPNPVEPFGLPALEAIASGVPVVACGAGAYEELLRDNDTALLFRPMDAAHLAERIGEVLDNESLRAKLARVPRTELQHFSPDVVAAQYLRLFSRVLGCREGTMFQSDENEGLRQ